MDDFRLICQDHWCTLELFPYVTHLPNSSPYHGGHHHGISIPYVIHATILPSSPPPPHQTETLPPIQPHLPNIFPIHVQYHHIHPLGDGVVLHRSNKSGSNTLTTIRRVNQQFLEVRLRMIPIWHKVVAGSDDGGTSGRRFNWALTVTTTLFVRSLLPLPSPLHADAATK